MPSKNFGDRVRLVREASGLNQRDFAKRLETSSGRISEIESGKSIPGCDFVQRVNQEFGTDVAWLLVGESVTGDIPSDLSREEEALLDNFRHSSEEGKDAIKRTAFALAKQDLKTKAA